MNQYMKLFGNKKRVSLLSLLLSTVVMFSHHASAAPNCSLAPGSSEITAPMVLQAQNITAGEDLPNGTVLFSQLFTQAAFPSITCTASATAYTASTQYSYTARPKPLSAWSGTPHPGQIYETGVPGIGVVVSYYGRAFPTYRETGIAAPAGTVFGYNNIPLEFDVSFIKIGTIAPGTIKGADLPSVAMEFITQGSNPVRLFSMSFTGAINIVAQTCQTSDVNVPMGTINADQIFKGKGTASKWVDASINLTNCPQFYGVKGRGYYSNNGIGSLSLPANQVSLMLTPNTSVIDSSKGIMGLKSGSGSASGVGIQLAYGEVNAPSPDLVNFDVFKNYIMSNGGATTQKLPLVARYIQTDERVTPGRADATATFTINYY
ncbi:fimbrial protein [Serratia sp. L9]|uniref:fimbrial protein n=1 Tax=Serratia sp. L9 TaxID=3423946 RepID=UPI003D66ECC8